MGEGLDLAAVFDASPNPYMVLDRDLRYVAANRAYLAATSRRADELIGRRVTDAFPHDPDDPGNANRRRLVASLQAVLDSGRPDVLPFIHYRIQVPGPGGPTYEDRYWSATHTPLPGADGRVRFILQHAVDVTEMYRRSAATGAKGARAAEAGGDPRVVAGVLDRAQLVQQRNATLDQDLRRLLRIFDQAPGFMAYLGGPEHVFELANTAYSNLVGGRELLGRTVREALPEIGDASFQLLDQVFDGGQAFVGRSMPLRLSRTAGGAAEEAYVDFVYQPITDAGGRTAGVLVMGQDITEQKRGEREREGLRRVLDETLENERAARAEAEQANELKDQFLAVVSHELRTPLTAILGWMQMWKSGTLTPEKRQRAVDAIERNARIQAQLIEDLLDVSRIISDKLPLDRDLVEVAAVVGAALETVRPAADAKGVTLASSVEVTGRVMGDGRRLQQVVWNLLSNAVKFTDRGGHVLLTVERVDHAVEIAVMDTGAGISAEFLPHVFERFRQGSGGAARTMGGLGLGLSIVRHVVQAHGGTVTASSPGEGKGATFHVRLPLAPASTKGAPGPAHDDGRFQVPAALRGMKLLVVDDEEDTREYVRALLQECGATVTVAASAAEALQALGHERPDVILSDLAMPGEDGYALIKRVRGLPADQGGRTPAVALTGQARKEDRTRAMLAGFQNHVTKPVAVGELLAVVASLAAPGRRA
jgi:signal transduction histidine kinase/ActR/RegA family two-component response regulator